MCISPNYYKCFRCFCATKIQLYWDEKFNWNVDIALWTEEDSKQTNNENVCLFLVLSSHHWTPLYSLDSLWSSAPLSLCSDMTFSNHFTFGVSWDVGSAWIVSTLLDLLKKNSLSAGSDQDKELHLQQLQTNGWQRLPFTKLDSPNLWSHEVNELMRVWQTKALRLKPPRLSWQTSENCCSGWIEGISEGNGGHFWGEWRAFWGE